VNCFRKRLFSRRRLKSAAAVLSLCPVLALTSCKSSSSEVEAAKSTSDQASQAEPHVMTVQITKPVWRKIQRTAQGQGALFAKESVILATKMPGYVNTVLVDFGDRVKAGQVLVEIEREELGLQVDAAESALKQARANYIRLPRCRHGSEKSRLGIKLPRAGNGLQPSFDKLRTGFD
jgi:membrane fusion protein (multidrug efflux system)